MGPRWTRRKIASPRLPFPFEKSLLASEGVSFHLGTSYSRACALYGFTLRALFLIGRCVGSASVPGLALEPLLPCAHFVRTCRSDMYIGSVPLATLADSMFSMTSRTW